MAMFSHFDDYLADSWSEWNDDSYDESYDNYDDDYDDDYDYDYDYDYDEEEIERLMREAEEDGIPF